MIDPRSQEEKLARMDELMKPIEQQLMMCDDYKDQLMMASSMMVTACDLFTQHMGTESAKEMFTIFMERNFK